MHGGRSAETYQLRDGMYFGEHIGNAANFAASVNPAVVQEVSVQMTGGLTAEAQSGGVIINAIGRRRQLVVPRFDNADFWHQESANISTPT